MKAVTFRDCSRLLLFLLAGVPSAAQPSPPAFEVASVKTAADPGRQPMFCIIPCSPGERLTVEGGRVDIRYMPLRKLIVTAYRIKPYQLSGPDWMQSERFDIAAKLPEGASAEQVPEMLQALLIERFKLAIHHENKDLPVFALVVGKNGAHLEPAAADADAVAARAASAPGGRGLYNGEGNAHVDDKGQITVTGAPYGPMQVSPFKEGAPRFDLMALTMPGLVELVAPHVDRPLIDMTELKGRYRLLVTMDMPVPPPPGAGGDGGGRKGGSDTMSPLNDPLAEGFFKALDRAGLKLEKRTAPVATVVVDRLEKTPTEN